MMFATPTSFSSTKKRKKVKRSTASTPLCRQIIELIEIDNVGSEEQDDLHLMKVRIDNWIKNESLPHLTYRPDAYKCVGIESDLSELYELNAGSDLSKLLIELVPADSYVRITNGLVTKLYVTEKGLNVLDLSPDDEMVMNTTIL